MRDVAPLQMPRPRMAWTQGATRLQHSMGLRLTKCCQTPKLHAGIGCCCKDLRMRTTWRLDEESERCRRWNVYVGFTSCWRPP